MIRAGLSIMVLLLWSGMALAAGCRNDAVFLRGDWGQARFNVDLADDDRTRALGLMHRQTLPKSSGMLFVYDAETPLSFWMRNTLIPLDMLFIDATGTVTHIHQNAIPHDVTPIHGGVGLAVLEINGGMTKAMGIKVGSEIRHPAFDQNLAAWGC